MELTLRVGSIPTSGTNPFKVTYAAGHSSKPGVTSRRQMEKDIYGGVDMRLLLATAVLLGVVLIGFASARTSAQGQTLQAGIISGEKLSLYYEPTRPGYGCTVIDVRGDFLGCRVESESMGQPAVERWFNLRLIARIERPAKQQ